MRRDPKNRLLHTNKPRGVKKVAQIEILSEREGATGWSFEAQILDGAGTLVPIDLSLAWSDYNLWSPGGGDSPNAVAEAVLAYMLSKLPATEIRRKFDASLARRLFADADEVIPSMIHHPM